MHIILLFSFVLLASCGGDRQVDDVLSAADSLVFVAPDSAVSLLGKTDLSAASVDQLDRHALLSVKAREKAGKIVSDNTRDSLLSRSITALDRAAEHYRGRGDSLEVQTLFYRGVLLGYRGDYSEALVSLMEAADRAADIGDNFYRAMSYREQATVYVNLYSYDQAARLGQKAADAFILADRPIYAAWERVYLPLYLAYSGNVDDAYDMIDNLKSDSIIMSNEALRRRLFDNAINVSLKCNDPNSAEKYFEAYAVEGGEASSRQLSSMAQLMLQHENIADALQFYDLAMASRIDSNDSIAADWALAYIYEAKGDYKSAYKLRESLDNELYNESNHLITHPYTSLLSDFYHEETKNKQLQLDEAGAEKLILILLSAVILTSVIVITLLYRQSLRRKDFDRERLISDIDGLQAKIKILNDVLSSQQELKNKDADKSGPVIMLNSICELYSTMVSGNEGYRLFGKNVSNTIDSFSNETNLVRLENFINLTCDNLMSRFQEQVKNLSNHEYNIAIFVFLGFSDSSITSILRIGSVSGMRQLRYKIRNKIKQSSAPDETLFLQYFLQN